ncbi:Glutamate--cysteine ligase, chloroplastic [Vitis vinifera]|uniref:Glutamate--cysteine ligase, chloroplastic n=1 Tax=Vitis vinifera TaxID=29760 RepID=A0A438JJE7_VITVI|nr:Glutamate--cysteine ligase, chloroplastic [Vitis vinifera]
MWGKHGTRSQTGPSYCMRSEVVHCKTGQSAVVNMTNNMEASKIKETRDCCCEPPTEDAVVATEPLTREDLIGYLASGCKPKEKWRGSKASHWNPVVSFELSGAPLETLHQTCAEVNSHLYQVKAVAEEMGLDS